VRSCTDTYLLSSNVKLAGATYQPPVTTPPPGVRDPTWASSADFPEVTPDTHAAELTSGDGHERFEFTVGLLFGGLPQGRGNGNEHADR
jgi:hypothetical protein